MFDRSGGIVGLVVGEDSVARMRVAQTLLDAALPAAQPATPPPASQQPAGGGISLKWVGAGAAVAGIAAFFATKGGDKGGDTPIPSGVRIIFPGGD